MPNEINNNQEENNDFELEPVREDAVDEVIDLDNIGTLTPRAIVEILDGINTQPLYINTDYVNSILNKKSKSTKVKEGYVKTVNDEKLPIKDTIELKGKYGEIVYISKQTPDLVYDFYTNEPLLLSRPLLNQDRLNVILDDMIIKDDKIVFIIKGFTRIPFVYYKYPSIGDYSNSFSDILKNSTELYEHLDRDYIAVLTFNIINNPIFKQLFKENFRDGHYYSTNNLNQNDSLKLKNISYRKLIRSNYHFDTRHLLFKETTCNPKTYINTLGKKYTFGLEIETASGYLPYWLDGHVDYTAVHDGSLRNEDGSLYGGEYVTGVLEGDSGLLATKLLCKELTKRCTLNNKCSVHVHLGNINFSKENVIFMYTLFEKIQNELFLMFPNSRRNNEYCRKITPLNLDLSMLYDNVNSNFIVSNYYNEIIKLLSGGKSLSKEVNKTKDHPKGHKCGYDHSTHRYCWVNMIPSIFNTRKNNIYTIEFRLHSATTSYKKIKNWLLICMALVDVVENHKQFLFKKFLTGNISLDDIIYEVYGNKGVKLVNYIKERKEKFEKDIVEQNEFDDNEELDRISLKNL